MGQQQPKEVKRSGTIETKWSEVKRSGTNELKGPCIYVLELEKGKYYVGKTNNLQKRLVDHERGLERASEWTKLYHYQKLMSVSPMTSDFDEDKVTKEMMCKYGIDNVRGGKYVRVHLSPEEIKVIQDEISHAKGECFICKKTGHLSRDCQRSKTKTNEQSERSRGTKRKEEIKEKKEKLYCERCHRNTHLDTQCNAFTTFEGGKLCKGTTKAGLRCKKTIEERFEYCVYHK